MKRPFDNHKSPLRRFVQFLRGLLILSTYAGAVEVAAFALFVLGCTLWRVAQFLWVTLFAEPWL